MPIYEYAAVDKGCPHCQARFDVLQKMADAPLTQCPECKQPVTRVISVPSVAAATCAQVGDVRPGPMKPPESMEMSRPSRAFASANAA